LIVFPNCKINLGLQVRRKRADGYHNLETVFYPVQVQDALEAVQVEGKDGLRFTASGREVTATPEKNICFKAYALLKERFPDLPSISMHLHKLLPSGAGLGGGSADGAFALRLINEKLKLALADEELSELALELGSDCPFFIYNKPCFAQGRGEQLQPINLDLAGYQLLLMHPGLHIPTPEAFRYVRPDDGRPSVQTLISKPVEEWRNALHNDFEDSVFIQYPELEKMKQDFYEQGALYAAMSGSGSTIFGIFPGDHQFGWTSYPPTFFVRRIRF
jgi:4-diphosphocytidyl-2-C-methyl-D-erythritol kinase